MSDQHVPDKFEETDWDARPVVMTVLLLFGFLIMGLLLGGLTQHLVTAGLNRTEDATVFHDTKTMPAGPRLQVDEAADLKEFHDREDVLLTSYQWSDRSRTAIRIPIDRAIDIVAAEGNGGRR